MRRLAPFVGLALVLATVRRLLFAHLAVVNPGSPDPAAPREIEDIELAQALYGRLDGARADHYRFTVEGPARERLMLLVPERAFDRGFRPRVTISGPAHPADRGTLSAAGDSPLVIAGTAYRLAAAETVALSNGTYTLTVASDAPGAYCLCVGSREPEAYADEATRARVRALLADA